jgi:tripartite ATP-independent transporter DctP family solute receptor
MRIVTGMTCLVLAGVATVAGGHPASAAEYPQMTIKFADIINRNFGYYQGMLAFKSEIEKRSAGRIKLDLLSDGALGSPKDALEALQLGVVQMAMNAASYTQTVVPEHRVWDMPFLFKNREAWRRIAYGPIGKEIGDKLEPHGLKFLTWNSAGGRGILSKKPIAAPADFVGQKTREQPSPVLVDILKSFGAQPVVMNLGDVYTSLSQGVIDSADVSIELVTSYKFYEVAKYYTEIQHIMTPGLVMANLAWWRGLDKQTQDLIVEVVTTTFRETTDSWFVNVDPSTPVDDQRAAAKALVAAGVTMVKPNLEALRAASADVTEKYQGAVGADLLARVRQAVQ